MPPPPAPVALPQSMVATKTSSRFISPKALSSGARPLNKSQAAPIVSNKSSIIARVQCDAALPPSLHLPLPKTTIPTVQPDEWSTASHSAAQGTSCVPKKKDDEKNTSPSPWQKAVNPWSLHATRPHLWSKIPSMHMSKAVLLSIRADLVLLAKMLLMLIVKKETLPPYHARQTRYKFPHQRTHSTALMA